VFCASACAAAQEVAGPAVAGTSAQEVNGPAKALALDLGGGVKMEMVLVEAGEFDMGDAPPEKPNPMYTKHRVRISKPYYIGKYDVMVKEFRAFVDATKYRTAKEGGKCRTVKDGKWVDLPCSWRDPGFKQEDNHPVVIVTVSDMQEFCKWATKTTGRTVRLPTEAEWEYAARGPKGLKYPWGDKWEVLANVADASLKRQGFEVKQKEGGIEEDDGYPFTSPCGAYKNASWCGAYDMVGNVQQRCSDLCDWYDVSITNGVTAVDPRGPTKIIHPPNGDGIVLRGSSWAQGAGPAMLTHRDAHYGNLAGVAYGFRVVVECVSTGSSAVKAVSAEKAAPTTKAQISVE